MSLPLTGFITQGLILCMPIIILMLLYIPSVGRYYYQEDLELSSVSYNEIAYLMIFLFQLQFYLNIPKERLEVGIYEDVLLIKKKS